MVTARKVLFGTGIVILFVIFAKPGPHHGNYGWNSGTSKLAENQTPPSHGASVEVAKSETRVNLGALSTRPRATAETGMVPANTMHNVGRNSARNALETEIYALGSGDVDLLASVITFEPEAAAKARRLFSAMPAKLQMTHATPERFVAFCLMGGQRIETLQVLTETPPRDEIVVELLEFKFVNESTTRKEGVVFLKDTGGWKYAVPDYLLERMALFLDSSSSK